MNATTLVMLCSSVSLTGLLKYMTESVVYGAVQTKLTAPSSTTLHDVQQLIVDHDLYFLLELGEVYYMHIVSLVDHGSALSMVLGHIQDSTIQLRRHVRALERLQRSYDATWFAAQYRYQTHIDSLATNLVRCARTLRSRLSLCQHMNVLRPLPQPLPAITDESHGWGDNT